MSKPDTKYGQTRKKSDKKRPATSPEAREQQLIAAAVDLAEQQLMDGTASSQVITHLLKLGTVNAKLQNEKLQNENELLKAKVAALKSQTNQEEMYAKAIKAMQLYAGHVEDDSEEDY